MGVPLGQTEPSEIHSSVPASRWCCGRDWPWIGARALHAKRVRFGGTWPWVKNQIVPPVNITIPTKIGSKNGWCTYPKMVPVVLNHGDMNQGLTNHPSKLPVAQRKKDAAKKLLMVGHEEICVEEPRDAHHLQEPHP